MENTDRPCNCGIMSRGVKSLHKLKENTAAKPSTQTRHAVNRVALRRPRPRRSSAHETKGSIMPRPEVNAAKNTSRKNNAPNTPAPGIALKASGKVTKISPGPSAASRPELNTIGKITRPASSAARVPVELSVGDAAARGLNNGDEVRLFNALGEVRCRLRVSRDLRPGVAVLPKGLWSHNTLNCATSNALVPDSLTDLAGGACFNDARVEVERVAG